MAKYYIKYKELKSQAVALKDISDKIHHFETALDSVAGAMDVRDTQMATLRNQIRTCYCNVEAMSKQVRGMQNVARDVVDRYLQSEKTNCGEIERGSFETVIIDTGVQRQKSNSWQNIAGLVPELLKKGKSIIGLFDAEKVVGLSEEVGNLIKKYVGDPLKDMALIGDMLLSPIKILQDYADGKMTRQEAELLIRNGVLKTSGEAISGALKVGDISLKPAYDIVMDTVDYIKEFADGDISYSEARERIITNCVVNIGMEAVEIGIPIVKPVTIAADIFFESIFEKDFSETVTALFTDKQTQQDWLNGANIMVDGIVDAGKDVVDGVVGAVNSVGKWFNNLW